MRIFAVESNSSKLTLPVFIKTKEDVHNLIKEILLIEDFLYKAQVRESGTKMMLPKTTPELDKFAEANRRNVLNHTQRMELAKFLRAVYKKSPVVSVYFTLGQNPAFVEGVVSWFRTQIHAQTLFHLSSHTKVGAGCIVRIKHKTYDFSLKKRFDDNINVLKTAFTPQAPASTATRSSFL
jgi:hypothetical protein